MLTFKQYELELIYQVLKSFINCSMEVGKVFDIKDYNNKKYNEIVTLINKILEKIENEYEGGK